MQMQEIGDAESRVRMVWVLESRVLSHLLVLHAQLGARLEGEKYLEFTSTGSEYGDGRREEIEGLSVI